jgi:mannosyltransferase
VRTPDPPERPSDIGHALRAGGAALVAIVIAAAALRFATLGVQSFSDDELFTTWLTRMPFGRMVSTVPESEATPHLFYLLEWVVTRVTGTGEVGMRVLPAVAGTLVVPAVYVAGAIAAGRRVALAAAAFAAVNPFLVWYSQEARAYSLATLLAALSLVALLAYDRAPRGRWLAAWALAAAAMLATYYFAAFLVVPEAVWLLLRSGQDRRRAALAVALPAAVGAALIPLAAHQADAVGDPGGVGGRGLADRVAAIPKNFLVGFSVPAEAAATVAAALAAAVALVLAWRHVEGAARRGVTLCAGLAAACAGLAVLAAPLGADYVTSRSVIVALVPVAVVLGAGFASGRAGIAALVVLAAVSIALVIGIAAERRYQRPDWKGAARALGPQRGWRAILFNPPFSNAGPFRVYFHTGAVLRAPATPPVRELALVALTQPGGFGPDVPRPPGGAAPPAPPGFRLVEDARTDSYRVIRYRAARAVQLPGSALARSAFRDVPAVGVVQIHGPGP